MPIKYFSSLSKSKFLLFLMLFKKNSFWPILLLFKGHNSVLCKNKIGNFFFENPSYYVLSDKHSENYSPGEGEGGSRGSRTKPTLATRSENLSRAITLQPINQIPSNLVCGCNSHVCTIFVL